MSVNWAELAKEKDIGIDDSIVIRGVTYRKIPDAPMYYISLSGRIYSKYTNKMRKPHSKGDITLRRLDGTHMRRGVHALRNEIWGIDTLIDDKPEKASGMEIIKKGRTTYWIDGVEYRQIPHFPNYVMSRQGEVISTRTYRRVKPYIPKYKRNRHYSVPPRGQVNISHNGKQKSLNVNTLIKKLYGEKAVYDN